MLQSQSEIAKSIAIKAHLGQIDKAGKPYIEHPAFVASCVDGDEAKAVAWLHDVVEDTSISFEDLAREGFSSDVLSALRLLTHQKSEPYFDYIRKVKKSALATEVKLADLKHNSDLNRLRIVTEEDLHRQRKYLTAIEILTS